jgi:hypothetical protein
MQTVTRGSVEDLSINCSIQTYTKILIKNSLFQVEKPASRFERLLLQVEKLASWIEKLLFQIKKLLFRVENPFF